MSKVRRPSRNPLAGFLRSVTNSPTAGSGNGACQPPCVKDSLGSSSGPPGACITPSRVKNVCTVSFMWFSSVRVGSAGNCGLTIRTNGHGPDRPRSQRKCGSPRPPVRPCETVNGLVGVEAAGIRQDPQLRIAEPIFLTALDGLRFGERLPIRGEAEPGTNCGLPPPYLRLEFLRTGVQVLQAQLVGTSARRRDDVGDADPETQDQFAVLFIHAITDVNQPRRDAGCVQRRPEA